MQQNYNHQVINHRQIDWQQGVISFQGSDIRVEPKLMQVLSVLVATPGQVVSQQELLEQAWPNSLVAPNTVQRCIGQLRKLLGDDASQQKVIQTLPKRGYCLNAQSLHKPSSVRNKLKTKITAAGVLFLVLMLASWLFYSPPPASHLIPVAAFDGAQSQQHSATISPSGQWIAYVQNAKPQQLKLKHQKQQTSRLLTQHSNFGSSLAFAPDSDKLLFSVIEKNNNSKCSQLQMTELKTAKTTRVQNCRDGFYTDLKWLNKHSLLYLWQQKDRRSHLELLNLKSGEITALATQWGSIHTMAYDPKSHRLAMLIDNSKIVLAQLKHNELTPSSVIDLPDSLSRVTQLLWQPGQPLQVIGSNRVYTYAKGHWEKQLQLDSEKQLTRLSALNAGKTYLAQLEMDNWDIHLKTPQQQLLKITSNGFKDKNARFVPSHQGISFLSDRNGLSQVWLQQGEQLRQISTSTTPVTSHLWSENGETLYYLSQQRLWRQTGEETRQLLETGPEITGLSQVFNGQLLIGTKINGLHQISLFEPENQVLQPLVEHRFYWAQFIPPHTLITNDSRGRLQKYVSGVQQPIYALPDFIIQPYYFAISGKLYVQDKALNIWAYEPSSEQGNIVDHYDQHSIFMTDYQPLTRQLLSENFIHKQQQLVWLETEKSQ